LLRSPLTSSSHGLLFLEKMMWQKVWVVWRSEGPRNSKTRKSASQC
jgi:hypothetical protein